LQKDIQYAKIHSAEQNFGSKGGSTMSIFGGLFKTSGATEMAVAKQNGVFALWKLQSEVSEITERALSARCISENIASSRRQKLNNLRQTIQDVFLLTQALEETQREINSALTNFEKMTKDFINEMVQMERKMDIKRRIDQINETFEQKFRDGNRENRISDEDLVYLKTQVETYKQSLNKSIENSDLRPEIRMKLLHELVDDYYQEIAQIYSEAVSGPRRFQ
jgi:hypothetical protein